MAKKEDLENYKPVRQIILEIIAKHRKDKWVIGSSQHGFMKRKSYLTDLVAFCNEMTGCWMKGQQWLLLILTLLRIWLFPITSS